MAEGRHRDDPRSSRGGDKVKSRMVHGAAVTVVAVRRDNSAVSSAEDSLEKDTTRPPWFTNAPSARVRSK